MKLYGEALIFVLLLITNLRVFFVKHTNKDPLASLAPLAVFLSICQILSWRISLITLYSLLLSILVLFTNFHAMLRFLGRLYIDHYSPLMKFWGIITSILTVAGLLFTIVFAPRELNLKKLDVYETETKLQGSFTSGLTPSTTFSGISSYIYEYTTIPNLDERSNVVLFVPDKRADSANYRPYLALLAKAGFTVCSADFFVDDNKWYHSILNSKYLRRITMLTESFIDNQEFTSRREFYTYNIKQELNQLIPLLSEKYGKDCRFFLVSDVMGNTAIKDYALEHPEKISGTFNIDSIPEYTTAGYGCIEGTEPFTCLMLGQKPDRSYFTTRYIVLKTSQAIKEVILKK